MAYTSRNVEMEKVASWGTKGNKNIVGPAIIPVITSGITRIKRRVIEAAPEIHLSHEWTNQDEARSE